MFGLTPYEKKSFDLFNAFHDFEKDFFGANSEIFSCKTDVKDMGDKLVLEAEMPGFDKSDIKLDISGDYLTMSAEHKTQKDEKDKDGKYLRRERTCGSYKRSFDITGIDAENIDAEYTNGILTVNMPKKPEQAPETKRLEIK